MAYGLRTANATDNMLSLKSEDFRANTSLIVLLEDAGVRTLNVASLAPTGSKAFDGESAVADSPSPASEATVPVLAGLLLACLLLPALVMYRNLIKQAPDDTSPPKGSEE